MDKTLLTNLPFWSSLSDDEKERVEQRAFARSYGKGTIINNCNNECLGMFLVLSGEIRTYLLSDEGREVTLFRLYTDDVCVLSASCIISQITFETQMIAQQDTELLILPVDVIASLSEKNIYVRCFL